MSWGYGQTPASPAKDRGAVRVDGETLQQLQLGLTELTALREQNALLQEQLALRAQIAAELEKSLKVRETQLGEARGIVSDYKALADKQDEEIKLLKKENDRLTKKVKRSGFLTKAGLVVGFVAGLLISR